MQLPASAYKLIGFLENAGYETYAVGGYVRDTILDRPRGDVDMTTSALTSQVHAVMASKGIAVHDTGVEHGTVTVVVDGDAMEVTTYRVDGPYGDHRHPDSVTFTRKLEDDLARRDYTINAMAYSPERGFKDLFGGRQDLDARLIRCVGDPDKRFQEDALRILRGLRLASQLGFIIEPKTLAAMHRNAQLLANMSRERVSTEFTKLLCGVNVRQVLVDYMDILGVAIPQLLPMKGFQQHNEHHVYDVLEHTAVAVETVPPKPVLRYAALLHDVGKPETYSVDEDGVGHFFGHAEKSEAIAHEVCEGLRLPTDWTQRICTVVKYHRADIAPERKAVRHWMNKIGVDALEDLLWVKRGDVTGLAPQYRDAVVIFDKMDEMIEELIEEDACFQLKDLALNGQDLLDLGFKPGPQIGETLNWLLDQVIDEAVPNNRDELLALAHTRLEG